MNNKEKYRAFCEAEKNIPIFSRDWWLDAVCINGEWDVALVENGGSIIATMPYYISKKKSMTYLGMPKLTQNLGPYVKYPDGQGYYKRLSFEKEVYNNLEEQLPKVDSFVQNFNYSVTNWLPFFWKGYQQKTNYTYVIEDLTDLDQVFSGFIHSKRKNIRKAEKIIEIKYDISAEEFYENHKMTLAKQGKKISYSLEMFKSIYTSCYERGCGKTIYGVDKEGVIHAALFVMWDDNSAYDLISTIDPDYRNHGAASLLIKEIIRYVADKTKKFDFEGSMIEGVENSFRGFGAVQKPYFNITRINSKKMKFSKIFKELITTLKS